jgi:hypothetical protein
MCRALVTGPCRRALPPTAAVAWRTAAVCLALSSFAAFSQPPPAGPASAVPAIGASAPRQAAPAAAGASHPAAKSSAAKSVTPVASGPLWRELKPAEQQALAPLAGTWNTLSEAQKRKWLALSKNFPKLSADEQATMQARMTEWAALSPQQRTEARLNFAVTKQLSPDEKKAKWEAYQALPPEEKKRLAAAAPKPPATAAAVKPVSPGKLATVPKKPAASGTKPAAPASAPAAPRAPAASVPVALPASAGRAS